MNCTITILPRTDADRPWLEALLTGRWGGTDMVVHGVLFDLLDQSAFVAWQSGERIGLVTYHIEALSCEVLSLDSTVEGVGIGGALLQSVIEVSRSSGCSRVCLTTTNDNLPALRFYQRRGFRLAAVRLGAVEAARWLKPSIPQLGVDGIPIRDEIELELVLYYSQLY